MKSSIAAAFAGVLLLSASAMAKETTSTLKVSGWHCQSCAAKTENAVKGVKGVKSAKAEKKTDSITVTFDDEQATAADVEGAITALKYKVEK